MICYCMIYNYLDFGWQTSSRMPKTTIFIFQFYFGTVEAKRFLKKSSKNNLKEKVKKTKILIWTVYSNSWHLKDNTRYCVTYNDMAGISTKAHLCFISNACAIWGLLLLVMLISEFCTNTKHASQRSVVSIPKINKTPCTGSSVYWSGIHIESGQVQHRCICFGLSEWSSKSFSPPNDHGDFGFLSVTK